MSGSGMTYDKCVECARQRKAVAWCSDCDIAFLKDNFRNWSSGNSKIDELIKHTQLNAKETVWMEGPRWNLDEEAEIWTRTGPIKVALKRLDNSQNMSQEFINQRYTGLHGPADKQISTQIYGVIPFVAPEVFDGNTPTKESDIYSFGMIMWILSAGVRPYCDRPHDSQLVQQICSGLRPSVISGTPLVFSKLMLQCLNASPSSRPTASHIFEYLGNWISDLSSQFDDTDIPFVNLEKLSLQSSLCHENTIYYSRPLSSIISSLLNIEL
ncbi:kinase-like domain-containing protein [Rhizophagus irregularis DAOM 181602=DAOM 197198]|uniref:Kinase-like domain-containing protein n=1 Tax=Rhizophagus irregularis (strain DAOM 181602 / DAOM 197198 / MUCL 43194) TaxID=747089 RepID=A0A2H5U513_RHIID|nr:kinase-like domain-containing protein [Rhizophagus irregularis DAOM 181602=DAOM 197198]POG69424.1 kinase-like domain-containing protein [Rhizophagus irregularis DAOM 181602=DAOM 197198]GBC49898.1 kinase-like domain-containing protein [Rhizophagus irregularis DAOM 181602=DAOM 197198]|eukprot:XP_025176290.1 kinase-like domain-containing protein [Rhizophagus irregularis DAOM 181602=DAOM 197198]